MNPSKRLNPIKKLADNKEKTAAQNLGQSLEQRKQHQTQLEQLINYRTEYLLSMSSKTAEGMSGDRLHQYHQFLKKLDSVIEQQQLTVEKSQLNVSKCQNKWQSDNSRATAIGKAMHSLRAKEVKAADKKESAQVDEMSTQAFLRSKQNNKRFF